jgi:hypothetical protein
MKEFTGMSTDQSPGFVQARGATIARSTLGEFLAMRRRRTNHTTVMNCDMMVAKSGGLSGRLDTEL